VIEQTEERTPDRISPGDPTGGQLVKFPRDAIPVDLRVDASRHGQLAGFDSTAGVHKNRGLP
jgi:hypothetical protein